MATASNKVVTGKVRFSYAHLFEAFQSDNSESGPKFSLTLLIPKSDKVTMRKLRKAQEDALEAGKDSKFGGKIPKAWTDTIHDGDEEADLERNPEYEGHWYMAVSNSRRPGVVDRSLNPILDPQEVYSGCYGRVSLTAFPFNSKGNKGVSFGLENVQKLEDGENLGGGGSKAEDDFDAVDDDDDDDDAGSGLL